MIKWFAIIAALPFTLNGCIASSDQKFEIDSVHQQLRLLSQSVVQLGSKGCDFERIHSISELLQIAVERGCAESGDERNLATDIWGNPYQLWTFRTSTGTAVFISSLGPTVAHESARNKQPFVRICLRKDESPTITYYDLD
jgi:hypothetical protein